MERGSSRRPLSDTDDDVEWDDDDDEVVWEAWWLPAQLNAAELKVSVAACGERGHGHEETSGN